MSFAVIKTGGKQYRVKKGDIIEVEKLPKIALGSKISFDTFLRADEKNVEIGTPKIENAVEGKLVKEIKEEKKIVFRYHPKTRYRKLKGHRQPLAVVEITKV